MRSVSSKPVPDKFLMKTTPYTCQTVAVCVYVTYDVSYTGHSGLRVRPVEMADSHGGDELPPDEHPLLCSQSSTDTVPILEEEQDERELPAVGGTAYSRLPVVRIRR
jgi:hypothetical protein